MTLNINLDKIAAEIESVLDSYGIPYEHDVVRNSIVPTWYDRKHSLLERFSKHPNWNNETCSVLFETQYERPISSATAFRNADALFTHYIIDSRNKNPELDHIYTTDEANIRLFIHHANYASSKITEDNQQEWISACPGIKEPYRQFPVGLRTSRAFARMFKHYGIDKMTDYEKWFASLADSVSPLSVNRPACLSFHPCDYLQMSHGTGWKSCHRINGGEWQGGTWSYMLDNVTSIMYTTEDEYGPMYNRRKVNRMVVCFEGPEILFSRLYPDYTDISIRRVFRNVVQEIYAQCSDVPNLWQPPMRYSEYVKYYDESICDNINLILSGNGYMQYPDYAYSEYRCELSVLKNAKPQQLLIGTYGICPITGDEYSDYASMTSLGEHRVHCEYCGVGLDEDDAYYDEEGNAYCQYCWNEHFTMCDNCGEWFRNEDMTETQNGEYVCDRCRDRYYVECCECGEWVLEDDTIYDADGNLWCEDCAEDNLTRCDDCGEYYRNDDIAVYHGQHLCPDCLETAVEGANEDEEVEINA